MRICFITTGDIKYIATMKRALGLADPLVKLGWEVVIVAQDTLENHMRISIEANLATTYFFGASSPIQEIITKHKLIRKIKPDVIWVCSLGLRNVLWPNNKHKVFVEHSELGSAIPDNKGLSKYKVLFFEQLSMYYSGLICASKFLEDHFSKKLNANKKKKPIFYSPYAYNKEVINHDALIFEDLKKLYGSQKIFLYMGTLTKNYGLFTMLKAVGILRQSKSDFKLLLMGRGRHYNEAKNYIEEYGLDEHIKFLGYVEEKHISSYFKLASAFIAPINDTIQDWARCPSKIYMYLPYKKPILTSKIGEPMNIFKDDGFYFDTENPETLAEVMKTIYEGRCLTSAIDVEEHSWDTRAKDFNNWFQSNFI